MNKSFEIDLNELIDTLEMPDSFFHYLNKTTGHIESIPQDLLDRVEDDDYSIEDSPELEHDSFLIAKDILHSDDYLLLDLKDDLDEFKIVRDFCASMRDAKIQEALLFTIQGKGAFGRFKHAIHFHKIENLWYRFRHQRIKQFLMQWCKQNGFTYTYERPHYLDEA